MCARVYMCVCYACAHRNAHVTYSYITSVHCDLHQDIPYRHTLSDGMLCTVHDNAFPKAKYTMSAVKCTKCSILHPHQMVCCVLIYILFVSLHKRCAQSAT